MDDAIHGLAAKVSAHLAPAEIAHVTGRNISSLGQNDVAKIESSMERLLRRRVRNPVQIELTLTISENVTGFLLVAETKRENAPVIEMATFRMDAVEPVARPKFTIAKKSLWEQDRPILDLAVTENQMLVLDIDGLTRYELREAAWVKAESASMPANTRDPRGRLTLVNDGIRASIPGSVCHGTVTPLTLTCEPGDEFTAGRNTLESSGWPPAFSHVQIAGEHLLAEPDGRMHVYDEDHKPVASFDEWGSDFALIADGCGANRILATSPNERDSIALYEMPGRTPARVSDPVEFSGPVTALWPAPNSSATAVARTLSTGRYEAYSLTVDCGR